MKSVRNRLNPQGFLILSAVLGLLTGDFLNISENRLLPGPGFNPDLVSFSLISGSLLILLPLCGPKCRRVFPFVVALVFGFLLLITGREARDAMLTGTEYARVGLGVGFWIPAGCLFLILLESMMDSGQRRRDQAALLMFSLAGPGILLGGGYLDALGLVKEYRQIQDQFFQEIIRHLFLAGGSATVAMILGVPLGYLLTRKKILKMPVFYFLNLIQTIPGLAMFSFLMTLLGLLSRAFPSLAEAGVRGIGWPPAFVALIFYGLFTIVRTSYESFAGVDRVHIHAARGLGLSPWQVLFRLRLPLAFPGIVNGIRMSLVMNIGLTTVTALIGAGGLGRFIFSGLGQAAYDLVLLGSLSVVVMALLADLLMRLLTPVFPGGAR